MTAVGIANSVSDEPRNYGNASHVRDVRSQYCIVIFPRFGCADIFRSHVSSFPFVAIAAAQRSGNVCQFSKFYSSIFFKFFGQTLHSLCLHSRQHCARRSSLSPSTKSLHMHRKKDRNISISYEQCAFFCFSFGKDITADNGYHILAIAFRKCFLSNGASMRGTVSMTQNSPIGTVPCCPLHNTRMPVSTVDWIEDFDWLEISTFAPLQMS